MMERIACPGMISRVHWGDGNRVADAAGSRGRAQKLPNIGKKAGARGSRWGGRHTPNFAKS